MWRRSFKSFEDLETDGFKLCARNITCKNQHSEDGGASWCYAQKPRSRSYGNPKSPFGRISKWGIHQWEHSTWACLKSCRFCWHLDQTIQPMEIHFIFWTEPYNQWKFTYFIWSPLFGLWVLRTSTEKGGSFEPGRVARAKRRSGFWIAQKFESRGVTGGAVAGHPEKLVTAGPIKWPRLSSGSLAPVW